MAENSPQNQCFDELEVNDDLKIPDQYKNEKNAKLKEAKIIQYKLITTKLITCKKVRESIEKQVMSMNKKNERSQIDGSIDL